VNPNSNRKIDAHRVADKLWIGGYPADKEDRPIQEVCGYFDVVVLCAVELQDLKFPCHVVKAPLDDAKPTPKEIQTALSAARTINVMRKRGKRVLVTCAAGVNRSAFIAALALMMAGDSAQMAISKIREHRRPPIGLTPLSNVHFVSVLKHLGMRPAPGQHRPISAM
jgi:hypothetical protein